MSSGDAKKKTNMDLAIKAETHYSNGQYGAALDLLHRIEKTISDKDDPRLIHNLRLAESAADGFKNINALRDALTAVKKKVRAKQLSKQSEKSEVDGKGAEQSNIMEGAGGVLGDVGESLSLLRDADTDCTILLYNLAALHLERKEFGAARSILEHLFRNIEPIEENVAVYVCLLYIDALVLCHRGALLTDSDRASFSSQTEEVLTYLEKLSQSLGTQRKDDADIEFRIHLYRARALLMCHQLKASKKEIKTALEMFQRSKSDGGGSATSEKLRNESALYLKANFEYLRQNYRKALKLLSSCHNAGVESDEGVAVGGANALTKQGPMYFNNVGCVHHKMGKYQAALNYFSKALKHMEGTEKTTMNKAIAAEVRYNCGVELLLTGNPERAFTCFQESAALLYSRPLLWLRMAECCIAQYCASKSEVKAETGYTESSWSKVGSGSQCRVILAGEQADAIWKGEKNEISKGSLLEAKRCLEKAIFLVNGLAVAAAKEEAANGGVVMFSKKVQGEKDTGSGVATGGGGASNQGAASQAEDRGEVVKSSATSVETAAYLKLAFVHLCLDEPGAALSYAFKLTATASGIPPHILVLGRQYAAEALCALNRPQEALELVSRDNQPPTPAAVSEVAEQLGAPAAPHGQVSTQPVVGSVICPQHPSFVKAALHTNLAACFAVQSSPGALDKAEKCARNAVAACPQSQHAHRMLVYVLLRSGNTEEAREWLKMYRTSVDIWA